LPGEGVAIYGALDMTWTGRRLLWRSFKVLLFAPIWPNRRPSLGSVSIFMPSGAEAGGEFQLLFFSTHSW